MRDFEAYYAAGTVWNAGGDPYSSQIWRAERTLQGVDAARFEALPFAGPPALLPFFGAFARVPFAAANAVWRVLLACTMAALACAALALAGIRPSAVTLVPAAAVALGFGPATSAFALGQIALPASLFAALSVRKPVAALGAWMQPNVALTAAPARGFVPSLAVFAAVCAVVLHGDVRQYAHVLTAHGAAERFALIQIAPAAIAYGFGVSPPLAEAIGAACTLAAAAAWLLLLRTTRDPVMRFCGTCALVPFAVPFFHEHDLLVLFVPAIVLVSRAKPASVTLAVTAALLCATDWLGLAQRPGGVAQTLLLVAGCGAALLALRPDARLRMLYGPAAVLAAIVLCGLAAQARPAPVWPDAMRALPDGIAKQPIAQAWNAELRASGMFRPDAFWALLRSLSLAGSALLVFCALRDRAQNERSLDVDVHEVVERRERAGSEVLDVLVVDP